jgi:hypothetical protein
MELSHPIPHIITLWGRLDPGADEQTPQLHQDGAQDACLCLPELGYCPQDLWAHPIWVSLM